ETSCPCSARHRGAREPGDRGVAVAVGDDRLSERLDERCVEHGPQHRLRGLQFAYVWTTPTPAALQPGVASAPLALEFSILGPLRACRDGTPLALGGARQRALLALLVLHADAPLSAERLAQGLWGQDAPAGGGKRLHLHRARLRATLAEPDAITTTAAGYSLRAGQRDVDRFQALAADGQRALDAGRPAQAAALLREALGLWRGPALADLALESFAPLEMAELEEERLAALEVRIDADLASGSHHDLIAELQRLTY